MKDQEGNLQKGRFARIMDKITGAEGRARNLSIFQARVDGLQLQERNATEDIEILHSLRARGQESDRIMRYNRDRFDQIMGNLGETLDPHALTELQTALGLTRSMQKIADDESWIDALLTTGLSPFEIGRIHNIKDKLDL